MPNMGSQTDGWDEDAIPCDDPECEIHSQDAINANTMTSSQRFAIAVGAGVAAGVGAILAAPVVIAAAGFGAAGVVAGSAAAAVQSSIGSVAAGSLFASLQSAGVLGLATATNVAVGGTVAAGTSGAVLLATRRNGTDQNTQTPRRCRNRNRRL